MGPVEEGAKVATGFIESMKTNPLALALVACNIILLALIFYIAHGVSETRHREMDAIFEMSREVQKLLYNCTPLAAVPGKRYVPQDAESHPAELTPLPQARPEEAPK